MNYETPKSERDAVSAKPAPEFHSEEEANPLVIWGGAAAILALFAIVFVLSHGAGERAPEAKGNAPTVTVTTLTMAPAPQSLALSGEARPRDDIRVFAPTAGVRIIDLLVDEGAVVRTGQPLARLDTRVAEAQTSAAQAALAEARASASRAADELRRAESIKDTGALSAEAIEARRTQAAAAQARERAAQAQLAEVNARLQGGYVRAPRGGIVIERTAQVGALVDGQALFRIAGGNALEVGVEVGENDMLAMRPGQRATFKMADGSDVTGVLRRVPAAIDSKTRTGEAVFDLSGNAKLRAGMFLRGAAQLPARPVLAAPQGAIKFEGEQTYVYVVGADNKVKRTPVNLGERTGGMIALRGGVEPGARIVAAGAAFLQDGDAINPVEAGASAAAKANEPAPIRDRSGG